VVICRKKRHSPLNLVDAIRQDWWCGHVSHVPVQSLMFLSVVPLRIMDTGYQYKCRVRTETTPMVVHCLLQAPIEKPEKPYCKYATINATDLR